ncbi:hypothetical protein B9G98_03083 [Wickerhamiella sorbophila]|uniref:Trafficking protein particle complex subunit 12 n=1 Tax=Wickerhamiella sorbophila TaxID=45607 RepID=A0A2T0FKE6_9ASCO|nr:hypothetical protein B9G98_03083 [Wickerhamiella sorbophila]PRT55463.1 hypothetical protein B9G98_03083 [Wickerhamiella sorbophila]
MYRSLVQVSRLKKLPEPKIPEPFQAAPESSTLQQLVDAQYWVDAVNKSVDLLADFNKKETIEPGDIPEILRIWYLRFYSMLKLRLGVYVNDEALSCLEFIDAPEAEGLDEATVWDLRLMLIPVKAKGINQTAIQQMFVMAASARSNIGGKDSSLWEQRLRKLGLHVAAALIGMRDPSTAIAHLESLHEGEKQVDPTYADSLARTLALLHLQMGNISQAKKWTRDSFAGEIEDLETIASLGEFPRESSTVNGAIARALAAFQKGDIETATGLLEKSLTDLSLNGLYNLFLLYDLNPSNAPEAKSKAAKALVGSGRASLGSYELFA